MNADRIKEIQQGTAFPNSVSVYQALMQVWNECSQSQPQQDKMVEALIRELLTETETLEGEYWNGYRGMARDLTLRFNQEKALVLIWDGY